jgi:pSer/pThr/pTyr-binding forkhead associated (FHA) protein
MITLSESSVQPDVCPTDQTPIKFRLVAESCSNDREVEASDFPVVLGRSAQAEIQLRDRWVSRLHCELDLVDGELIVRDLGAKHGTYVNGRAVAEERLHPGDEIRIGLTALTIVS